MASRKLRLGVGTFALAASVACGQQPVGPERGGAGKPRQRFRIEREGAWRDRLYDGLHRRYHRFRVTLVMNHWHKRGRRVTCAGR